MQSLKYDEGYKKTMISLFKKWFKKTITQEELFTLIDSEFTNRIPKLTEFIDKVNTRLAEQIEQADEVFETFLQLRLKNDFSTLLYFGSRTRCQSLICLFVHANGLHGRHQYS